MSLKIRPVTSPEQMEFVLGEARKDQPGVHLVSHMMTINEQVRGALMTMPIVFLWMHTENTARMTKDMITNIENWLANTGNSYMCIPCHKDSIQASYMERLGYTKFENFTLFVKGLQ